MRRCNKLVLLSINDILFDVPAATTIANLKTIVTRLQENGADVMLFVPLPVADPRYLVVIPELRAGLQNLAVQMDIPLVDLGLTYNDSYAELNNAGLMSGDGIHPNATLYADIGSQLAALLAGAMLLRRGA